MSKRVIVVLDVTFEEANAIAEKIAGIGPYYKAFNLPVCLDLVADMPKEDGSAVKTIKIRSEASAALGGKDTPDFAE